MFSNLSRDLAHPSINFHSGGHKVQNLALFPTSFNFELPAFENAARYPNSERKVQCCNDHPMSSPWWSWVHSPVRRLCQLCPIHPLSMHAKRTKSSITQPWIIWFRSHLVQSLSTWHAKCCKSSRSRSRSQSDITCAKIRKIINNSAENCSISLKFRTDFDHATLDVPWTFKVNVRVWHNVSASKEWYNSGMDKLSKVIPGENYPRAKCNT